MSININNGLKNVKIDAIALNNGLKNVNIGEVYINNGFENKLVFSKGGRKRGLHISVEANTYVNLNGMRPVLDAGAIDWGGGLSVETQPFVRQYTNAGEYTITSPEFESVTTLSLSTFRDDGKITAVDVSDFKNVIETDYGCFDSQSIETIDLRALTRLQKIKTDFASYGKVTDIYIPKSVTKIEDIFANSERGYNNGSIYFEDGSKLKEIGNNFCSGNKNLNTLRLNTEELITIEHHFLSSCDNLISLDMSECRSLESIGKAFLIECTSLREIWMPIYKEVAIPPYHDPSEDRPTTLQSLEKVHCGIHLDEYKQSESWINFRDKMVY